MSEGRIKTGVYHAEIKDRDKEELHGSWRLGEVKVICATIGASIVPTGVIRAELTWHFSIWAWYR